MATKKKSKGVLEKISDAVTTGAEAVIDVGAKAIHAVGDLMPTEKPAPKPTKAKPKVAAKTAVQAPKLKVAAKKPAAPEAEAKSAPLKTTAPAAKAKPKAAATAPTSKASKAAAPAKKKAAGKKS